MQNFILRISIRLRPYGQQAIGKYFGKGNLLLTFSGKFNHSFFYHIFVTLSGVNKLADVESADDITLQCSESSNRDRCQAVVYVTWLEDISILRKFFDLDEICKLENWKVQNWKSHWKYNVNTAEHTCGKPAEEPAKNESNPQSDLKRDVSDSHEIGTGEKLFSDRDGDLFIPDF